MQSSVTVRARESADEVVELTDDGPGSDHEPAGNDPTPG
jgi:hypothetical protein